MSYQTPEVEVDNGRIASRAGEVLPAKAHGLLTILGPLPTVSAPLLGLTAGAAVPQAFRVALPAAAI